ncbi:MULTISPECIES: glycosyl hydrolase 115 family protein [unclassified Sphingobium]|uniref:glycosyl hydrolase 115 family protein n=1 Tax=unclassified Sphingobium TaxID=2611147 RepID=UPI00222446C1|nr:MULTISPECIES: glycosyl hydrolase 115 family protein [unclassified Sphingobium]MCW2393906.1 hypothetical protein [Sphingobium sp. B8D3B]MCW2417420.1 hypothetical protein [Sphingobium sp. B8D3C]
MREHAASGVTRRRLMGGAAAGTLALLGSPLAARARTLGLGAQAPFPLIRSGVPAGVIIDSEADSAVGHVATRFAEDIGRVCGTAARVSKGYGRAPSSVAVIIGVLGQSRLIDGLIAAGKIDVGDLAGAWEAFRRIVVDHPAKGIERALVIVGSDRRGAVFGTYDVSEQLGVSPWHWFADVPVARRRDVSISATPVRDQPKVRYRGFFINDEAPCLSSWAEKTFGGFNTAMYAHVFELLLRLKGNYLWPAMWAPRAFAADDPQNMTLADEMGVVMGNSHHEPMLRAQDEWHRNPEGGVTGGRWDYTTNADNLREFWRGGIARMMSKGNGGRYESVVTIGMRGDGDEAMAEGTAIPLLEQIVTDQRGIIAQATGQSADKTPQVWALYKEVQDYYDHGMQVPDDVILLFADDNWGQIRRLPDPTAKPRSGGYGVYYHFDYVGVPRNYKWLNTNQIEKVWQQMDLAYQRDARAMWIVNVGDIKPMEYPLSFFLAMAWNPEAMTPQALAAYPMRWAAATFGPEQAEAIGAMMTAYSQYAARRKPELIDQDSFPLGDVTPRALDGGVFGALVAEWDALERRMLATRTRLRPEQHDAYDQLLAYPISAMANLYRLYYGASWNKRLAQDNDPRANHFADMVETSYQRDADLTAHYHRLNGGKWDGMMAQVHIGYVIWQQPTQQSMPSISRVGDGTTKGAPLFVTPRPADPRVITIAANDFSRARQAKGLRWTPIAHLGQGGSAMVALPQGRPATTPADGVALDYEVDVPQAGTGQITAYLVPTLDTMGQAGVALGVSLDDGPVTVLRAVLEPTGGAQDTPAKQRWAQAVIDNSVRLTADLGPVEAGRHRIGIWRMDDNVVLERLVLAIAGGEGRMPAPA